jgi:hypothetical protein
MGDPMPFRLRPDGVVWPWFSGTQLGEIADYFDAAEVFDNTTTVIIYDARKNIQPPPILVGGKPAVFLGTGETLPFGCLSALGCPAGSSQTGFLYLGGTLATELQKGEFPSLESFRQIFELSPEAEAVSYVEGSFIFEYIEADGNTHRQRTLALPTTINKCTVSTLNGPVRLRKHLSGNIEPKPEILSHDICDDSFYEVLRPGVMLSGLYGAICRTTAGVLVEKGDNRRLTVAEHGFDPSTPSAHHPNMSDGVIGEVNERFPNTDIGLLSLLETTSFENQPYFQVSTPLTRLLHSSELRAGLTVGIDTFVTGYQELRAVGVRVVRRNQGVVRGRSAEYPYLAIDQGIFATTAEVIRTRPQVRDGMCGAPLVVVSGEREVLGGVAGFFCYSDVKGYNSSLLCYAEPADVLINDGWSLRL